MPYAVVDFVGGGDTGYLARLDRCLLDGYILFSERTHLAEVATELGLSGSRVESLHRNYHWALVRRAWDEGVLTGEEQPDVAEHAALLELDDVRDSGIPIPSEERVTNVLLLTGCA